jgi:predicted pyridoxine 5'-phosphate oxidase superfamily flavin-nucleotide-binding protein
MNPVLGVLVTSAPPTPTGTAHADMLRLELSDPSPEVPDDQIATRSGPRHRAPDQPVTIATDEPDDPLACQDRALPGSAGEHLLQAAYGTAARADRFYADQVLDHLNPRMTEFLGRMEMAFVATAAANGECDCSLRTGPPGFIEVLDDRTLAYPEYRGNGVLASLGNMLHNPHIGIFLVDFTRDLIGLHVNGDARIVTPDQMAELDLDLPEPENNGRRPVQWVVVRVTEAYVHCSKRIPYLVPQPRVGGGDARRYRGTDYFGVTARRRASSAATDPPVTGPVPDRTIASSRR